MPLHVYTWSHASTTAIARSTHLRPKAQAPISVGRCMGARRTCVRWLARGAIAFALGCSGSSVGPAASSASSCDATRIEVARVLGFADYEHAADDPRVRATRAVLDGAGIASEGMIGGIALAEDGTCADLFVDHGTTCGWYAFVVLEADAPAARVALTRAGLTPIPSEVAMTSSLSEGAREACRRRF